MSPTYQIALNPDLNISAEEFAVAWNAVDETRQTGQLVRVTSTPEAFHSPETAVLFLETAVLISSGVLINLITQLIKDKYFKKEPKLIEIPQPDGSKIIVVTTED